MKRLYFTVGFRALIRRNEWGVNDVGQSCGGRGRRSEIQGSFEPVRAWRPVATSVEDRTLSSNMPGAGEFLSQFGSSCLLDSVPAAPLQFGKKLSNQRNGKLTWLRWRSTKLSDAAQ